MSKGIKITLLIVGVFLLVIIASIMIISHSVSNSIQDMKESIGGTEYTNSDEDIKKYILEEHNQKVKIIENKGKDPSGKGLVYHDVVVETVEDDPFRFDVYINYRARIKGDNYDELKELNVLNSKLKKSEVYQQIKQLGFSSTLIKYNHNFFFHINQDDLQGKEIGDDETMKRLYELTNILKNWIQKEEVEIDTIKVDELTIYLDNTYSSWQEFANSLAEEPIYKKHFVATFIDEDEQKVEKIESRLHEMELANSSLECDELKNRHECASYSFSISKKVDQGDSEENQFDYDNIEDQEKILQAMELIKEVDLPIEQVLVDDMYSPVEEEDQKYTVEELEEKNGYHSYSVQTVEVKDWKNISSVDDIYFEYRN